MACGYGNATAPLASAFAAARCTQENVERESERPWLSAGREGTA